MKDFDPKDTLIQFGSSVKAIGDNRIGGHLVLFGDAKSKDLYGDYFTAETDFDLQPDMKSAVYYQHSFDYHFKSRVLSRATLGVDDVGIWIDAQLDVHDEYLQALSDLISEGIMGWSSGTAGHLVESERRGKAYWIKRWPLGLDASITPNPADPRQVDTLRFLQQEWDKQYGSAGDNDRRFFLSFKNLSKLTVLQEVTPETPTGVSVLTSGGGGASEPIEHHVIIEVKNMAEQDAPTKTAEQQQIAALEAKNAEFAAKMQDMMEYIESQKKLRSVGYVTDDGGAADPQVKSFADFALAISRKDFKRLTVVYKSQQSIKTDLVEDSGELGGWLIPEEFDNRLVQVRNNMRSFVNLVPRVTVRFPSGRSPRLDIFFAPTAGTGNTAEAAGLTSAVRAEGGAYTETNPLLEQIEWRVNDVASGSIQTTKEVRADAPQLEGTLLQLIALNDITKQEFLFLRGNGVGQPLGVLNSPAMIAVTTANDNVFAYADALNMLSRIYMVDQSRTCWIHHPGIMPDVGKFEVGTGGAVIVANPTGPMPQNILGYERFQSQHSPQANNSGDVILVDWSQYQVWDLGGSYIDFSEHVGFMNGLDTWRFGRRMDAKPLWLSTMTLSDPQGSYTQSPFVKHDD